MSKPSLIDVLDAQISECDASGVPVFPETANPPPPPKDKVKHDENDDGWWPVLYPTQMKAFNCYKKYMLLYGERSSGKTIVALHRILRHCWETKGALVMICTVTKTSAKAGGAWEKLYRDVLPKWHDGLGMEFTVPKMDAERNHYIKVSNCHGEWVLIMLKSIPYGDAIRPRFKGAEPSMVFFDELTETDDESYFTDVIQQIWRRSDIKHQHYIAACNPADDGEDHWVYKTFIERPEEEKVAEWERDTASFHIPMSENVLMENRQTYIETVKRACSSDPTAYDRLILGKWVKKQSGKGIFAGFFNMNLHVRGEKASRNRIMPNTDYPIIMGYDLGDVNQGVAFMQELPMKQGMVWVIFDELAITGEPIPYEFLVPRIMRKMDLWCRQSRHKFSFRHISDKSAWDRFRAVTGSYDYMELQNHSREQLDKHADNYQYLDKIIRVIPCPKPDGSVEQRTKILIHLLQNEQIIIDAHCEHSINMFMQMRSGKDSIYTPTKNNPHKHIYDAISYPILFDRIGGVVLGNRDEEEPEPEIY